MHTRYSHSAFSMHTRYSHSLLRQKHGDHSVRAHDHAASLSSHGSNSHKPHCRNVVGLSGRLDPQPPRQILLAFACSNDSSLFSRSNHGCYLAVKLRNWVATVSMEQAAAIPLMTKPKGSEEVLTPMRRLQNSALRHQDHHHLRPYMHRSSARHGGIKNLSLVSHGTNLAEHAPDNPIDQRRWTGAELFRRT